MSDTRTDRSITDEISKGVKDLRDAGSEVMHRSAAEAEHARRETEGDSMPLGERVTSGVNEAKERLEAEGDKTKRNIRDNT